MPTIALVDDDRNILTSLRMVLEAEGYKTQTYNDGASALDGFAESPPDLLSGEPPEMTGQLVIYINGHDRALAFSDITKNNPDRMGSSGPAKPHRERHRDEPEPPGCRGPFAVGRDVRLLGHEEIRVHPRMAHVAGDVDDPRLLQRLHPPQTRRRRQAHPAGEIDIGRRYEAILIGEGSIWIKLRNEAWRYRRHGRNRAAGRRSVRLIDLIDL